MIDPKFYPNKEKNSNPAIWWVTQDLRLSDHPILHELCRQDRPVLPLFILDPVLLNSRKIGERRWTFLFSALKDLNNNLQKHGGELLVKISSPEEILPEIMQRYQVTEVFAQESFTPYGRQRQERIRDLVPFRLLGKPSQRHPLEVLKADRSIYTVFTPYKNTWKSLPYTEPLSPCKNRFIEIQAEDRVGMVNLPKVKEELLAGFKASEDFALQRLKNFTEGDNPPIYSYATKRDLAAEDATASLSPYFHFGLLSARQAVSAARKAWEAAPDVESRKGAEIWLNELIWREFYNSILYHFPRVSKESFRRELNQINWENNEVLFRRWCQGQTGYPFVDAGMRQLTLSGWMHNRLRMVTASFLVKNLLVNWQWGEEFFLKHLLDADPASNNGGWQWTAGTGTDAAPYFRVFNPVLQGKKFDPQGSYIHTWVPELKNVPERYIHTPWEMPREIQEKTYCVIGKDYPEPLVDLKTTRQKALDVYQQSKTSYLNQSTR